MVNYLIKPGFSEYLGATIRKNGINFAIYSEHATSVELLLFKKSTDAHPSAHIHFDPSHHKTGHTWHIFLEGLKPKLYYNYRINGPHEPERGHLFNRNKLLLDPYGRAINYDLWQRDRAIDGNDNLDCAPRSVLLAPSRSTAKARPNNLSGGFIYELHVGNFTKSKSSKVKHPGKFLGLIEKIPYLKSLGVAAVELMPVFDFGVEPAKNVWGYGTIGFFALDKRYCVSSKEEEGLSEFKSMVEAFHKAGIEVYLDAVFGYTAEHDLTGPTVSLRGIDNAVYYMLDPKDKTRYLNYSGCLNTLNYNHPAVLNLAVSSLEYWSQNFGIDGFRLDEASIFCRNENDGFIKHSSFLNKITQSEILKRTKIILEPWDALGGYLLGSLPTSSDLQWNDRFRDDLRRFIRGDGGLIKEAAHRITGSPEIFKNENNSSRSVNFVACHDGFTLCDLVSYSKKHNEANNEDNRDGLDENFSANYGIEGQTEDLAVINLRQRQIKNFLALLFLSKGVPMLGMGDEVGRTQQGNNNAYCHDSALTWFDWDLLEKNENIYHFAKQVIKLRKQIPFFADNLSYSEIAKRVVFHGCLLNAPGWNDANSKVISCTIDNKFHLMANMDSLPLCFELPKLKEGEWHIVFNTAYRNNGFLNKNKEKGLCGIDKYLIDSKSVVLMEAR